MKEFTWGHIAAFGFCILLPGILLGMSNYRVFPDAFSMAMILLLITVGVSAMMAIYSSDGDSRIRQYALVAEALICIAMVVNLAGHWQLSREVSAAKDGVAERHTEENRQAALQAADRSQQIEVMNAQKELARQQARLLSQLPVNQRRGQAIIPIVPPVVRSTPQTGIPLDATESKGPIRPSLNPDEIRATWNPWLTIMAYVEVGLSILGCLGLIFLKNWDGNGNGIADWKERKYQEDRLRGRYRADRNEFPHEIEVKPKN